MLESWPLWVAWASLSGGVVIAMLLKKKVDPARKEISRLMTGPTAFYSFHSIAEPEKMQHEETGQPDVDMRIALARQEEKVEGLRQTVEREFARVGQGLTDLASAMNQSVASMKSEYVSRAEHASTLEKLAKIERIVYGTAGIICISVIGALLALVVVKP